MSRAALIKLLIAQTVLLVLAAWIAAYFARDEFLLATAALGEEEIPGSAPPTTDEGEGVPTVRLSAAAQRQVGIEVAAPEQAQRAGGTELPATVLDVQPLVDLHGRLQAARHEHAATLAAANASEAERKPGLDGRDRLHQSKPDGLYGSGIQGHPERLWSACVADRPPSQRFLTVLEGKCPMGRRRHLRTCQQRRLLLICRLCRQRLAHESC